MPETLNDFPGRMLTYGVFLPMVCALVGNRSGRNAAGNDGSAEWTLLKVCGFPAGNQATSRPQGSNESCASVVDAQSISADFMPKGVP